MSASHIIVAYLVAALSALAGAAVYAELRRRRFGPSSTLDRVFRCRKCGYVYTDDPDVVRSRCSQCGQMNDPMQF